MTAFPMPSGPSPSFESASSGALPDTPPVFALKELVARLQREQYKIQDLLSSLGFALRSLNNLNQFLELIPMIASRVTDAGGGALVLFRADGQVRLERLHCQSEDQCQGVRSALEAATRQVTASFQAAPESSMMSMSRNAMLALDRQVNRYLGDDFQMFGTAIIVQNVERGRLYVFSRDPDYAWTETRQKLVRLVADQTSVAIENNELTVALRKKERLDRELEIGAEIQLQLLPRECPAIQGMDLAAKCQTAQRVGGDYYDFIPTTFDQLRQTGSQQTAAAPWSFAIGDVMGKGVPAGLIVTMMRGMLRAEVLIGLSPDRILHDLNQLAQEDLAHSHRFVTLFYSDFDPRTRLLRYANAAHNPPLIWRRLRNAVDRLDAPGLLIGLQPEAEYGCEQIVLDPGDVLLYYTDGVTEAAGLNGERFDEQRLVQALHTACRSGVGAQGILDQLYARLDRFVGPDRPLEDDASMVVLKVREELMLPSLPA